MTRTPIFRMRSLRSARRSWRGLLTSFLWSEFSDNNSPWSLHENSFCFSDNEITYKQLKDKENIVSDYKRLKIEVDQERSENRNTKEKLNEVQQSLRNVIEENEKLRNVTNSVEEKLKKKQAVFAEFQTEKEKAIEELKR